MAEAYSEPKEVPQVAVVTCKQRYEQLTTERFPFLRRAREAAELTIPSLMPPEGSNGATELATPFQSAGAEGVNSLASKLLLALLPPNSSFFRLQMDDMEKDKLVAELGDQATDVTGEIEKSLGKIERAVLARLEQVGTRIGVFDALKHLIVCGNVLVQVLEDGAMRLHYLNNYVCKRDPAGNVLEIITRESIAKTALPPEARALCEVYQQDDSAEKEHAAVDVFTRIVRKDRFYKVHQEIHGMTVPGSEGSYPLDKSAWIPLRWTKLDGQDYGRGRVEEFIGDFWSLESLSQSIVEGSAMAAKVLFLVHEAGTTDRQKLNDATNGEYVEGDIRDIDILKLDKFADFQVAQRTAEKLELRLKQAFLVHEQRDAERVTAEEVRAVIAELEKALGGVYAVQAQDFQLPFLKRVMHQMQRKGALPQFPDKLIAPKIITGLDALGRGADFEKLRLFVADLSREFGPEVVSEYINVGAYATRKGTALQIDLDGIIRSEEDVQAARQAKQQAELVGKLAPQFIKSGTEQQVAAQQAQAASPAQ